MADLLKHETLVSGGQEHWSQAGVVISQSSDNR